jgi:hypothetical protein
VRATFARFVTANTVDPTGTVVAPTDTDASRRTTETVVGLPCAEDVKAAIENPIKHEQVMNLLTGTMV